MTICHLLPISRSIFLTWIARHEIRGLLVASILSSNHWISEGVVFCDPHLYCQNDHTSSYTCSACTRTRLSAQQRAVYLQIHAQTFEVPNRYLRSSQRTQSTNMFEINSKGPPNWWPPFYMVIVVRDNHSSSYYCSACIRIRLSAHKKTGISARFAQWYCYFRWKTMKQVKENYDYRISEGWGMSFTCYEKSIWLGL